MKNPLKRLYDYLHYRFIHAPLGGGKPVPESFLNQEYKSGAWDHFLGKDEEERHRLLVELIQERGSALSLLDLGCGSGRLVSLLDTTSVSEYLGVDLSEEGLAKARSLNSARTFIHGNYESWKPERSYDVITFNECLGYARIPARTIETFCSFLKPQGCIIISHFRWGNHAAIWKALEKITTTVRAREARNAKGQIWDLKVLIPR
jgi:trans-aconitate methyltransferase